MAKVHVAVPELDAQFTTLEQLQYFCRYFKGKGGWNWLSISAPGALFPLPEYHNFVNLNLHKGQPHQNELGCYAQAASAGLLCRCLITDAEFHGCCFNRQLELYVGPTNQRVEDLATVHFTLLPCPVGQLTAAMNAMTPRIEAAMTKLEQLNFNMSKPESAMEQLHLALGALRDPPTLTTEPVAATPALPAATTSEPL